MNKIDKERLAAKIIETYPWTTPKAALARAEKLLERTSNELAVNISEWIDNKEISDVWVGEYCVKMIMEIRGDNHFLDAIEALVLYSENPKAGLIEIWRTKK